MNGGTKLELHQIFFLLVVEGAVSSLESTDTATGVATGAPYVGVGGRSNMKPLDIFLQSITYILTNLYNHWYTRVLLHCGSGGRLRHVTYSTKLHPAL